MASGMLLMIGLAIFLAICLRAFVIIQQYEEGLHFRLGKYMGIFGPGVSWIIPGADSVAIVDTRITTNDIPIQDMITKDNVTVSIDAIAYYRILEPEKLILKVSNYREAIVQKIISLARARIGEQELNELIAKRVDLNRRITENLEEFVEAWGVDVLYVEIQEVQIRDRTLSKAMVDVVAAERRKRAMILESEGTRYSMATIAEGDRKAQVSLADGLKEAAILNGQGTAEALNILAKTANKYVNEPMLCYLQLGMLKSFASSASTNLFVPYNLSGLTEALRKK